MNKKWYLSGLNFELMHLSQLISAVTLQSFTELSYMVNILTWKSALYQNAFL